MKYGAPSKIPGGGGIRGFYPQYRHQLLYILLLFSLLLVITRTCLKLIVNKETEGE